MPYCICCFNEYPSDVELCPECAAPLSEEKGGVARDVGAVGSDNLPWPNDENGEPAESVFLMSVKNPSEYELVCSLLRAYEIPVVGRDAVRSTFSQVLFGGPILGCDIFVPAQMHERSREAVASYHSKN